MLAVRHLLVRPGRALLLLGGFALGVAVMIVLLSVGDAMLEQSRDPSLVGGGDLVALPEGVDLEAMRSGGLAGMFFRINGARFVAREMLGGPRQRAAVAAVSPVIAQKLLFVRTRDSSWTVRADGTIPGRAAAVDAPLRLLAGRWIDTGADSAWITPDRQQFYDQLDHFHRPSASDASWAEWDYFKLTASDREWWYITLLVAGVPEVGGEVLVTHRRPDGRYDRQVSRVLPAAITFDSSRANLDLGTASVTQQDGVYRMRGMAGAVRFDVTVQPVWHEYFPPVELGDAAHASGYVVPVLTGHASGWLCSGVVCDTLRNAPAYHDHNWGSWSGVTWEWGTGRSASHALLYGGVIARNPRVGAVPFFLALNDSLGIEQIYRFDAVTSSGARRVPGWPGLMAPDTLRFTAAREADTLRVTVLIGDVAASRSAAVGRDRVFLQMHGRWHASGTAAGVPVADSGNGAFETWVR
jgi:hypothetical protein